MRNIMGLFHDISILDAQTGITFRGYTIPECDEKLPKSSEHNSTQPLPESMLWLLLTGEVPTEDQIRHFTVEIANRFSFYDC